MAPSVDAMVEALHSMFVMPDEMMPARACKVDMLVLWEAESVVIPVGAFVPV